MNTYMTAKGMTYKSAISGLPYGGGKAVILGYPVKDKHELFFRSLGRFIKVLNGLYITGMDLGTAVQGLRKVGYQLCRYLNRSGARLIVYDLDERRKIQAVREFGANPLKPEEIVYAPDYVINAGGIIVTDAELNGKDHFYAKKQVENIYDTLTKVFEYFEAEQVPPQSPPMSWPSTCLFIEMAAARTLEYITLLSPNSLYF
jgi:glutamate dehydrogenase/leucine dehydrogenase